jgi:hypothetical protein
MTWVDAERDVVTARTHGHPGLDHLVVRLVPDMVHPAEDLVLGCLGLVNERAEPVGLGPRRAMGFPDWSLVNDQEHAGPRTRADSRGRPAHPHGHPVVVGARAHSMLSGMANADVVLLMSMSGTCARKTRPSKRSAAFFG